MVLTEGQTSDHKGAPLVLDAVPSVRALIADCGYHRAGFREALAARGIAPCIPSSRGRKRPFRYDKGVYRRRHGWFFALWRFGEVGTLALSVDVSSAPRCEQTVHTFLTPTLAPSPSRGMYEGVAPSSGKTGRPLVAEAVAVLNCRVRHRHNAFSHGIFVGGSSECAAAAPAAPF